MVTWFLPVVTVVVHPTGQLGQIKPGGGGGLSVVTPVGPEGLQGNLACGLLDPVFK